MADYKIRVRSSNRMSNSGYHRSGKPTWWARVGDTFARFGQHRGDSKINAWGTISLECDGIYTMDMGVGKGKDGCREKDTIVAVTNSEGESIAEYIGADDAKKIRKLVADGMSYSAAYAYVEAEGEGVADVTPATLPPEATTEG